MRIDHVKTHDITRYQLTDGGRHLLTFETFAELESFAEIVVIAVEVARYKRDVDAARIAAEGLHSADKKE